MAHLFARLYLTDPAENRKLFVHTHQNTVDPTIWSVSLGTHLELVAVTPGAGESSLNRGTLRILDELIEGLSTVRDEIRAELLEAEEEPEPEPEISWHNDTADVHPRF